VSLRKIGDYTIIREQGRGGMGTVFQALSPDGATVALKTVLWSESVDPRARWEVIERFQREARAARSLTHPNICQVLDFGADEHSLYIVMEFLDGQTVGQIMGVAGGIRVVRAVAIVRDVGEALAHAHEQGIIHRDVKPGNIMVLRGGQVKLTDFGLASVVRDTSLTTTGGTMGTVHYMSPEQVRGEKVDARSDIFSLGATFYEMLAGRRPFDADEPAAVMNQILTLDPPVIPGLSASLSQTLTTCLRKEPQERFGSAREMITSLATAGAEGRPGSTAVLPTTGSEPAETGRRRRRLPRAPRRWLALAAATVLVVVGAFAVIRPWTDLGGQTVVTEMTPEAPTIAPGEPPPRPDPPAPLDSPEAEDVDVRKRANFHYEADFEKHPEHLDIGPGSHGVTTIEGDALVLAGSVGAEWMHGTRLGNTQQMSEFVTEVRFRKLEGPDEVSVGIVFGGFSSAEDLYGFSLKGNGNVSISRCHNGEWSDLASLDSVPHVNRGNAENVLKAVRRGGSLHLFVNGHHVLTEDDFDIRSAQLHLYVGPGIRAAFSQLRVEGISLKTMWDEVWDRWERLDMLGVRKLLTYMQLYQRVAASKALDDALRTPDRQHTVLVIGSSGARLEREGDAPARLLVERINERGAGRDFHWAKDITDAEALSNEYLLECPLIAIGGPDSNQITRRLKEELPRAQASTDEMLIYHDIPQGKSRVAIWGTSREKTAEAVGFIITSGLLDEFLDVVWEGG
jgi:serine/threonine-protein kinase